MHMPTNTIPSLSAPSPQPTFVPGGLGGLVDFFSDLNMVSQGSSGLSYVPPKQVNIVTSTF
jgi:hypothetical protein